MKITKTVYNSHLLTPDSVTVQCGDQKKDFSYAERGKVGEWMKSIWENEFFPTPAYVYYNIDWDSDHILYCKYECEV